jgi:hypothetical protein
MGAFYQPQCVQVANTDTLINMLTCSNTLLSYNCSSQVPKWNNCLESCWVFASSFMRPGGSFRVLENPPERDWFFDSDFFQNAWTRWFLERFWTFSNTRKGWLLQKSRTHLTFVHTIMSADILRRLVCCMGWIDDKPQVQSRIPSKGASRYTKEQVFQSLLLIDSMDVPKSQPSRTSSHSWQARVGWSKLGSL